MKLIKNPNLSDYFNQNYYLFMHTTDDFGRKWRYKSSPKKAGSIGYFDSLTKLRTYSDQLDDLDRIYSNRPTKPELRHQLNLYRSFMLQ